MSTLCLPPTTLADQLSQLPTVVVDGEQFLSLDAALEIVAARHFPDGIHSEDDYDALLQQTLTNCATLGFGGAVELHPPHVPFQARGRYLKAWPALPDEIIAEIVDGAGSQIVVPLSTPQLALREGSLIEAVAHRAWQLYPHQISAQQRDFLTTRCRVWLERAAWHRLERLVDERWRHDSEVAWLNDLTPDLEALTRVVQRTLDEGITALSSIRRRGLHAAFNYSVRRDPEGLIGDEIWQEIFAAAGFELDEQGEQLRPLPLTIPRGTAERLPRAIQALPRYRQHDISGMLRLNEVVDAFCDLIGLQARALPDAQLEQLLSEGVIGAALVGLGFETTPQWVAGRLVEPAVEGRERFIWPAQQVQQAIIDVTFAEGLPVAAPVLLRDEERLIYLELVGPKESVRANWAALRANYKRHYVGRGWLASSKDDGITTLKQSLPCGWEHWALVHRQCAVKSLQPAEPFYLLDDGTAIVPPVFFTMLAHSLAVPLMVTWCDYLWQQGRLRGLISSLREGSHGMGGWRVEATETAWRELVQRGLREVAIALEPEPAAIGKATLNLSG